MMDLEGFVTRVLAVGRASPVLAEICRRVVEARKVCTSFLRASQRGRGGTGVGDRFGVLDVLRGKRRLERRSVWHPADLCVANTRTGEDEADQIKRSVCLLPEGLEGVQMVSR